MSLVAALFRGEQLLVHAELVYVFADPQTQTSRPVPQRLRAVLEGYEAGAATARAEVLPWPEAQEAATALRRAVFVAEQGAPVAVIADDADADAVHVLVLNRFDRAVAAGRLVLRDDGRGQIGRMAVAQAVRGSGLGRLTLDALLAEARARSMREVMLEAHASAVPFYAAAGFTPRGELFGAAGFEQQELTRAP
jgi:predicted GNAT family N-acyltransferase